ncbi:MAG TPA: hypothetical protein VM662_02895, partial [Sphingomonas sp.]|nr:hypothetical protein [Sphingomonas sp.]
AAQTADSSITEERALAESLDRSIALAPPGSVAPITLDLIRAHVRIEPAFDGTAAMIVRAARPDQAARIVLRLRRDSRGIEVTDLYPARSRVSAMDECLPPPDPRGDFWLADAGMEVVLRVPSRARVTVHLRDGTLRDLRAQ